MINFLDNENILNKGSYIDAIHSGLNGTHPELLKDIYTLQTYTNLAFIDCCSAKFRDNVASNILDLITNSDLSEEDSLEVLKKNKIFMKDQEIENLDLVEEHLEEAVRTKNY